MNESKVYKPHEFADLLGVTVKTLQNWDNKGVLKAYRTPTNKRYYTIEQYYTYIGINYDKGNKRNVSYSRVSSNNQKDDLKNQTAFIRTYCNNKGIILDECIEDIGSGLNYNRKNGISY